MITRLLPSTVLIALLLGFFSGEVSAVTLIPSKKIFEVKYDTPSRMALCMGRLWAYSLTKKKFIVLSPQDGRQLAELDVPSEKYPGNLTSLSCFREKLLASFGNRDEHPSLRLYDLGPKVTLVRLAEIAAPGKGRITDVNCQKDICYVIQAGKIFRADNTSAKWRWIALDIPASSHVLHASTDLEANPFENWQDKMMFGGARYTRLTILPNKEISLLDPFRASAVFKAGTEWRKLGGWGVWEEHLLMPKDIEFLSPTAFVVSDPALKALLIYSTAGAYLGGVGLNNELFSPSYAFDTVTLDNRIFVADLQDNKILALDITKNLASEEIPGLNPTYIRTNLFRREQAFTSRIRDRCLSCHDGTVTDEFSKFLKTHYNHPVDSEFKGKKPDLKLEEGKYVTCATCHVPHHEGKSPHLVKDRLTLCKSCHEDRGIPKHNHPMKADKSCTECHIPHGGVEKLLRMPSENLCVSCHKKQSHEHRPVKIILDTERAKDLRFGNGRISCFTCHAPHSKESMNKMLRPTPQVKEFCASCHDKKTPDLYSDFHERVKNVKGGRK